MKVIGTIYSEPFLNAINSKNWPLYSMVDLGSDDIGNLPATKFFAVSIYEFVA